MLEYDRSIKEVFTMSFRLNHLHIKSSDPSKTAEWYVDTLGAKIVSEVGGGRGYRLDLHGMPLNMLQEK